jgi:hypothetical protein
MVKFSFRWLMIDLKYPLKLFVKDPIGNKLTGFHGLSSLVDSYQRDDVNLFCFPEALGFISSTNGA